MVAKNPDAREKTLAACYSVDECLAIRWRANRIGSISRVIRETNERKLRQLVADYILFLLRDFGAEESAAIQWFARTRRRSVTAVIRSARVDAAKRAELVSLWRSDERKCV